MKCLDIYILISEKYLNRGKILNLNRVIWNDFNKRFIELINERFNTDSVRVKKLLNQTENVEIIVKSLLTLSLCISNQGNDKLKIFNRLLI